MAKFTERLIAARTTALQELKLAEEVLAEVENMPIDTEWDEVWLDVPLIAPSARLPTDVLFDPTHFVQLQPTSHSDMEIN